MMLLLLPLGCATREYGAVSIASTDQQAVSARILAQKVGGSDCRSGFFLLETRSATLESQCRMRSLRCRELTHCWTQSVEFFSYDFLVYRRGAVRVSGSGCGVRVRRRCCSRFSSPRRSAGLRSNHAHFDVISAHGVPPKYIVLAPSVTGSACRIIGVGPLLQLAVEDALAKVPQADVLARWISRSGAGSSASSTAIRSRALRSW